MQTILTVVLVIVCIMLVIAVLLQQGKGADAGAAFGSGASGTVFGAGGSATFMSKATAVLATVFFCLTLALAYLSGKDSGVTTGTSVIDGAAPVEEREIPTISVPDDEDVAPQIEVEINSETDTDADGNITIESAPGDAAINDAVNDAIRNSIQAPDAVAPEPAGQ